MLALIQAARAAGLDLKPSLQTAIGLEFSAGACNALDEYTLFLTPGYYNDVQAMLQGKFVSIGVDLGLTADGQVEIVRVYPKSPAEAKLLPHDRIVRINRQGDLTPDQAADLLRGEAGTVVDVEVPEGRPQGRGGSAAATAGLPAERRGPAGAERDDRNGDAFDRLRPDQPLRGFDRSGREGGAGPAADGRGARRLILDLRGNPGGSFKAGVQVAELFLNEGVVVYSESPLDDFNHPFKVESRNPVQLPVVVLVDRDTASAAEVVAGALKEHRVGNTLIVGQTTFGKGSIQGVIPLDKPPLDKAPGGIRITIAKLFSPGKHQPYTGRGVTPDVLVDQEGPAVTTAGIQAVVQLLKSGAMNPGMMMR